MSSKKGKTMNIFLPDIGARDYYNQLVAVVEIKNWSENQLNIKDVTDYLDNLLTNYDVFPKVPYFLLISQEKGFLWEYPFTPLRQPKVEFPMQNVINRFLTKFNVPNNLNGWLLEIQLENAVIRWLEYLGELEQLPAEEPENMPELAQFVKDLKGVHAQAEARLAV
jgi:hypothetical protein